MIISTIFQVLICLYVSFLSKQVASPVPAIKLYFFLSILSLIVLSFCIYVYILISIFGVGNFYGAISVESFFNFGFLAANIFLVFFTGYTLFITNKRMNIELKEKNLISEIELLKTRLDNYYIPIHRIFFEYLEELNELNVNDLSEDDMNRLSELFGSKTKNLNAILRQYAYLESSALYFDSLKFLLDYSFYVIVKDKDNSNFAERKKTFLEDMEKMFPSDIAINNTGISIANVFEEYYNKFDINITADEAFKICITDVNTVIMKLDKAIFSTNNLINKNMNMLSFIRH